MMLDEFTYTQLLQALREPIESLDRPYWQTHNEAIEVTVVLGTRTRLPARMYLRPLGLIEMWHDRQADFHGFSVLVTYALGEQRSCVSRCEDETLQEAQCTDTAQDMENCMEVTRLRCGSGDSRNKPGFVGWGMDALVTELRRQYERS